MKTIQAVSLFTLLLLTRFGISSGAEITDDGIRDKLVGTWIIDRTLPNATSKGEITLSSNGTLTSHGIITTSLRIQPLDFEAIWVVNDGFLIEKVTKSNETRLVGLVTRDKVIWIDDTTFSYKTEQGDEVTRKRKIKDG